MPIITNVCRLLRKSTAMGLVLVLVLVGLSPAAEAGLWVKRDWSRVQALTSGTRVKVELYKDQAPKGKRTNQGLFRSATAQSITLLLPNGERRTSQKQAVRKVMVYRPVKKRYQGWIVAAVGTALFVPLTVDPEYDINLKWGLILTSSFIVLPTAIGFLVAPRWGDIYYVPRDRQNETTKAPPQQSSSAEVPVVTEAERIHLQARRAVMQQGLPLQFPARSLSSGEEDIKHGYGAVGRASSGKGQVKSIALTTGE